MFCTDQDQSTESLGGNTAVALWPRTKRRPPALSSPPPALRPPRVQESGPVTTSRVLRRRGPDAWPARWRWLPPPSPDTPPVVAGGGGGAVGVGLQLSPCNTSAPPAGDQEVRRASGTPWPRHAVFIRRQRGPSGPPVCGRYGIPTVTHLLLCLYVLALGTIVLSMV